MLQRLADFFILCPSHEEIPAKHKLRRPLEHTGGELDVWVEAVGCKHSDEAEAFILKFGGSGSRAERATTHPLDAWSGLPAEAWAVNWPGFGRSDGRASVQNLAAAGVAAYEQLRRIAAGRPILITGNSLGCTVALHVAARFRNMAGLLLRNPMPLRRLVLGRHGWYSAWVGAWLIARKVPHELDAIVNARGSDVPAAFVTCGRDRVVPPAYQQMVFDFYAGPKRLLILEGADHEDLPSASQHEPYRQLLNWLRGRAGIG